MAILSGDKSRLKQFTFLKQYQHPQPFFTTGTTAGIRNPCGQAMHFIIFISLRWRLQSHTNNLHPFFFTVLFFQAPNTTGHCLQDPQVTGLRWTTGGVLWLRRKNIETLQRMLMVQFCSRHRGKYHIEWHAIIKKKTWKHKTINYQLSSPEWHQR